LYLRSVHPLYGQIDIKGSSNQEGETVKEDLKINLNQHSNVEE
jgi:hypothetical protein